MKGFSMIKLKLKEVKTCSCDGCFFKQGLYGPCVRKQSNKIKCIIAHQNKNCIFVIAPERFWKMELKRIKKEIISCKKCFFKGQGYEKCVGKNGKMLCAVNGELYYLVLVVKKF